MILTNIKRVIRLGFVNFWRNGFVSLASILMMTTALLVVGVAIVRYQSLNALLGQIKDRVDVSVYFTTSSSEQEIKDFKSKIEALPEVKETLYSSREEELVKFKERHKDDQLTLQALEEIADNPLGASIKIKAKDPAQYEGIALFLESEKKQSENSIIDKINYSKNKTAIDVLNKIINASKKLGLAVSIFFGVISILITFNTIYLTIHMAREEISVMRLVGASRRYIKGPFIVEGLMYGLISTILSVLILLPLSYWAGPYILDLQAGINIFDYLVDNIFLITGSLLISGFAIGAISSYLAVKKYLKV